MIEYTIEDEFETNVDHYWNTFFSEAFNAALWKAIDIDWELLEFRREGEGEMLVIHRRQRMTPRRNVPSVLQKLVKGAISYEERNRFERAKSLMTAATIPSFMSDRLDAKGNYSVIEAGPGRVKRIWKASVSCSVPLLGGQVEKSVVQEVQESYRKTTAFMREWLKTHPAG